MMEPGTQSLEILRSTTNNPYGVAPNERIQEVLENDRLHYPRTHGTHDQRVPRGEVL